MANELSSSYGGIEAGGTKFVCAVGSGPGDLRSTTCIPTSSPDKTIADVVTFFREQQQGAVLNGVGVGAFGPLDLNPASPTFGYITTTPKLGWTWTNLVGAIRSELGVCVCLDTDVNVAALGEWQWGVAQGKQNFLYLTVGTGIGGGGMINGDLMHGLSHPEMGHIRIPHDKAQDPYDGCCPYHGDCLEGLASGPAMAQRWGQPPECLPAEHPAWELEAHYLALAVANFTVTLAPQQIIIGGGLLQQMQLLLLVRKKTQGLLNGYIQASEVLERIDEFIVAPSLGQSTGVLGAIALAIAKCRK